MRHGRRSLKNTRGAKSVNIDARCSARGAWRSPSIARREAPAGFRQKTCASDTWTLLVAGRVGGEIAAAVTQRGWA